MLSLYIYIYTIYIYIYVYIYIYISESVRVCVCVCVRTSVIVPLSGHALTCRVRGTVSLHCVRPPGSNEAALSEGGGRGRVLYILMHHALPLALADLLCFTRPSALR